MLPDKEWIQQRKARVHAWGQACIHALDRNPGLATIDCAIRLRQDLPKAAHCILVLDAARANKDALAAMAAMSRLNRIYSGLARATVQLRMATPT